MSTYYLDGAKYDITLDEINNIMGFPNQPEAVETPDWGADTSFYDFSCQLIGGPRRTYKASQISHPVFRYIQRALAFTIFARGETVGTMGENEIYFIYAMLNAQTRPEALPNVGAFMLDHIIGVRDNTSSGGMISIGGFVTRLAIYHGVLPAEGPVYRVLATRLQKKTEFIDMAYLYMTWILQKQTEFTESFLFPVVVSISLYLHQFLSIGQILPLGFCPFIWPHHYSRSTSLSQVPSL